MYRKSGKFERVVFETCERTDKRTDRYYLIEPATGRHRDEVYCLLLLLVVDTETDAATQLILGTVHKYMLSKTGVIK